MVSYFNKREKADFGTSHVSYTASKWDIDTKIIYLLSRRPSYFQQISDPQSEYYPAYLSFLQRNYIENPTQEKVAEVAALELSNRIVTPDLLNKIYLEVQNKILQSPDRNIKNIRVICPFPIDPETTSNEFAPALTAMVTARLEKYLEQKMPEHKVHVFSDLDPAQSRPEKSILNIVKNDRGSTSDPEAGKEGLTYIERLIRQPVYTGTVDKSAIYIPVDDFLVSQSTLCSLMSYIQSNGGITTSPVNGCELFTGIRHVAPKQETLDYLNTVFTGKLSDKTDTKALMSSIGLQLDFEKLENNTLSNVEMMFLAGIFADSKNPEHFNAFKKTIESIGATLEEAKGNSPSDIFYAKPLTVSDLKNHFYSVLQYRQGMLPDNNRRLSALKEQDKISFLTMER